MRLSDYKDQLRKLVSDFNKGAKKLKNSDEVRASAENSTWFWVQAFPNVSPSVHFEIQECGEEFVLVFHNELHGNSWAKCRYNDVLREKRKENALRRHFVDPDGLCRCFEFVSNAVLEVMKDLTDWYPIENCAAKVSTGQDSDLTIESATAKGVLSLNLFIPQYQRGYEWSRRNILDFLNGIWDWRKSHQDNEQYHIGTVVLREDNLKRYAVIDGQQRLTTLAILQYCLCPSESEIQLLSANDKRLTDDDKRRLIWGKRIVQEWIASRKGEVRLLTSLFDLITISAVKIPNSSRSEIEFKFFSSINSLGKRLSDYDLIKTHHLRYILDDKLAEVMSTAWHKMETSGNNILSALLNETLYRLRTWRGGGQPRLDVESSEDRPLYRHFSADIDPLDGYADSFLPLRFDSILPGGGVFFKYIEKYRSIYETFLKEPGVVEMRRAFGGHSCGVLLSGMLPIAFLFYSKFGGLYLNDALYSIVYRVSSLRNETQVRSSYLRTKNVFAECIRHLDRVPTESMFVAYMLNPRRDYSITNDKSDDDKSAACRYWNSVRVFLAGLERREKALISIPSILFKSNLFECQKN